MSGGIFILRPSYHLLCVISLTRKSENIKLISQYPVVQEVDNAVHRINHYPVGYNFK